MFRPPADDSSTPAPHRQSRRRIGRALGSGVVIGLLASGCALGQRPTIVETPTAVGTMTGDAAIDAVLGRMDGVQTAVFTADYTAIIAFGSTASSITVTQDGRDPINMKRSVTIGDVRYINAGGATSTCSVITSECANGIDAAKVSDTGVTPEFAVGDMAKRLRRDAVVRVDAATPGTREVPGGTATCVDVPVAGGTKQYCVFDDGVLARFVGADVTIDVTGYRQVFDDSLLVV